MNNIMFVLEDMKKRIPIFQRISLETKLELKHTEYTYFFKKNLLELNPKVIFLDHDLGGKTFVKSDGEEETGYTIAKWIVKNDPNYKERIIIIHSANPNGAMNIQTALNGHAHIIPISNFAKRSNVLWKKGLLTMK